jgi:hypothetical protein
MLSKSKAALPCEEISHNRLFEISNATDGKTLRISFRAELLLTYILELIG